MKKFLKVLLIVICSILLILLGVRAYFRLSVVSFYNNSEKGFIIPESNSGFIAQGISYDNLTDSFFVTGYMNNSEKPSPIYITTDGSKEYKKVNLYYSDGKVFNSHCGGLAITKEYVYVANGASIEIFKYSDIINAKDNDDVKSVGTFETKISSEDYLGVAFLTIYDNYLYLGEFYREQNYKTLDSHKFTTPSGDYNQALMLGFKLSDDEFGFQKTPSIAYSLTDLVQGACFDGNNIYLSTSYAIAFSHIYKYDITKASKMDDVKVLDTMVPLYALDNNCLVEDIKIAPMSEEIEIVNGKMYIMCESASNKYFFGKFTSSYWCYKYNLEEDKEG